MNSLRLLYFSDVAYNLLESTPNIFDVTKLGVIDATLLSDIVRLANLQAPNTIHRYPNDKFISKEMEELEKSQKELDAEIAQVCLFKYLLYNLWCMLGNVEQNITGNQGKSLILPFTRFVSYFYIFCSSHHTLIR